MNKTLLTIVTIVVLSSVAYLVMYHFIGFEQKKALWISGGAGVAMILFDVVLLNLIRKR
jgi:hypothetical protein